jgi:twitching motility protein PilT
VKDLAKFLQYLDRSDVTEIVFRSGATAAAKKAGKLTPVTREPLSARHILKLVDDTPLQGLIPAQDGASGPATARMNGITYIATMARSGETLMLRVRREGRNTEPPKVPIASIDPRVRSQTPANRVAANAVEEVMTHGRKRDVFEAEPSPARDRVSAREPAPEREPFHAREPTPVRAPAPACAPQVSYRPSPAASPIAPFVKGGVPVEVSPGLRRILVAARQRGASDVHIMSGEAPRFRCGGNLRPEGATMTDEEAQSLVMPLLDARNAAQLDELGYADFACEIEGAGRFRVNVNKQRTGVKGCFRLVMPEPATLESLGLPVELQKMLDYHQGLVVVSGPSGAGKTTTLAALVDMFNSRRAVHIITVEDPVEILHPIKKAIVTQREVGAHTKSFHTALKGSLREDPDVIAIGELRDRETVEKALEASETGHLVFATMSTPSGASTIDRLIDMFPPDDQSQVRATLAGALKFVVSQRLVPRRDGSGQVAAAELLTGGMALWTLIRDDKLFQLPSLLQRGRAFGMIRIEDSLDALVGSGVISADVAKQYADDPRLIGNGSNGISSPQQQKTHVAQGKSNPRRNPFKRSG